MRYGDRSRVRKFALEAAVVCGIVAFFYLRATPGTLLPAGISVAVAAVLVLIGVCLPDGPPRPREMGDYEDGPRGAVRDDSPVSDRPRRS
jgi:hypothetical protein